MSDYSSAGGVVIENKVVISGEEKIRQLGEELSGSREQIQRLNFALESTQERLRQVKAELENLKNGRGINILEEELERFRDAASRAQSEFSAFLTTVKLNDTWGRNDDYFEQYFQAIKEGSLTASEAIMRVKSDFRGLIEENYKASGGLLDSQMIQQITASLDALGKTANAVLGKIQSIETNGVKSVGGAGGAGASNITAVIEKIGAAANSMNAEVKESYNTITNLVKSINDFANVDETRLLGVSHAFRNIADIGKGHYGSKTIDNIIYLTKQLQALSGAQSSISFDFTGLNELKVSKASMSNLATYLPQIAEVNMSKLEKLSKIDFSNLNNIKVSKASVESIAELTKAINVLRESKEAVKQLTGGTIGGTGGSGGSNNAGIPGGPGGTGGSKSTGGSGDKEEAKAIAMQYSDATRAIKAYYSARAMLSKTVGHDIILDGTKTGHGGGWSSKSGAYDELANTLNRTKAAFDLVTSSMKNLPADKYSSLMALMTSETNKYNLVLESMANKEYAAAQAASESAARKSAERESTQNRVMELRDAERAIKSYYAALMQLSKSGGHDLVLGSTGSGGRTDGWVSESGHYDVLASTLNRTKTAFDLVTSSMKNMPAEHQARLTTLLTQEAQKYNLALETQANRERDAAEAEKQREAAKQNNKNDREAVKASALAYREAEKAVKSYYTAMLQLSKLKGHDIINKDGVWSSEKGDYNMMAEELNRRQLNLINASASMEGMPLELQSKWYALLVDEINRYNLALEIQTNKEREAAAASVQTSEEQATAKGKAARAADEAIANGKKSLNAWSAADMARNKQIQSTYAELKAATSSMIVARRAFDGGKISIEELNRKTEEYNNTLARARQILSASGYDTEKFGAKVKRLAERLSQYFGVYRAIMFAIRSIRKMIRTSIELDDALTQLKIVTHAADAEYKKFGDDVLATAQKLGASAIDLINSTTTYARLGYSIDDSKMLAEYTAMLQGVGDIDASSAQNAITSIIKAYDINVSEIESVMDKLVIVGNNYPISVSQIAEGMTNASSALHAAGNTFEESVALLTAANTTIQNAAKSSTGLRTIAARIRNTKTELDDLGETMTEAAHNDLVQMLTDYNVTLTDTNGEYKSTYNIMQDIAAQWDHMTSMEQAALATAMSGTRQQAVFYSIIDQFNEAAGAMTTMESKNSAGTLVESYNTYLDSVTGHIEALKASFAELSMNIMNSNMLKFFIDIGKGMLDFVSALEKANMLLPTIIASLLTYKAVRSGINSVHRVGQITNLLVGEKVATDQLIASVMVLSAAEKRRLVDQLKAAVLQGKITEAKYQEILVTLGLATADGTLTVANKALGASFKTLAASIPVWGWIALGISVVIEAIVALTGSANKAHSSIEDLNNEFDQLVNSTKSVSSEFRDKKDTLDDIISEYVELSKGVNELGENSKLTDEEYSRFIELGNQLAEMFPSISYGMDENGNAMLNLSYSADTLKQSLTELIEEERELANLKIVDMLPDLLSNVSSTADYRDKLTDISNLITRYKGLAKKFMGLPHEFPEMFKNDNLFEGAALRQELENITNQLFNDYYEELKDAGIDVANLHKELGKMLVPDSNDIEKQYDKMMRGVNRTLNHVERELARKQKSINASIHALMSTDINYNTMSNPMQSIADMMAKGIDFGELNLRTTEEVQGYIYDSIIDPLNNSSDDVREAFSNIFNWQQMLRDGIITEEEFSRKVRKVFIELSRGMDEANAERFFNLFIQGANSAGIAGDNYIEVVYGLIQMWSSFGDQAAKTAHKVSADVTGSIKTAQDAMSKANGIITPELYASEEFKDYRSAVEYVNGVMRLNAEAAYDIAKAKNEEEKANVLLNKEIDQNKYLENARQIEKLRAAGESLTDEQELQIQTLLRENSTIVQTCKEYDILINALDQASSAYTHWISAQKSADYGDIADDAVSAIQLIADTYNSSSEIFGNFGSKKFDAAVDWIVPDHIDPDDIQAVESYMNSLESYLIFDKDGKVEGLDVDEFLKNSVEKGLMEIGDDGSYLIAGQKTMADFAEGLHLSEGLVQAAFDELQLKNHNFDWGDEIIQTSGDLAVAATEAAERLRVDRTIYSDEINEYKRVINEASSIGIDINKTVFGNIDTNNRQVLEWTEENIAKYRDALKSWGAAPDEMLGSVSTVFGASAEYDGIEIAFSPILQTNDGPVLLNSASVDKYINTLIESAGAGWSADDILRLDTTGLNIDGVQIKNIIADIGDTAIKTGMAMHYVGNDGAIASATANLEEAASAAGVAIEDLLNSEGNLGENISIKIDVSDLASKEEQVDALNNTINQMNGIKASIGVDSSDIDDANAVIQYCMLQIQKLEEPAIMRVNTSSLDEDMAHAISLLQEFQNAKNNYDTLSKMGMDTTEAQGKLEALRGQISAIDQSIKGALSIDSTSVDNLVGSIKGITEEILQQNGIGEGQVVDVIYDPKTDLLPEFFDPIKREVRYEANLDRLPDQLPPITRNLPNPYVYHASMVGGSANANGDWSVKQGGQTLVGELGQEIVVDPRTGRWYTVGDHGAEFRNIPQGSIVFNHKQSKDLLEDGSVSGRARALAGGSALVTGGGPNPPHDNNNSWMNRPGNDDGYHGGNTANNDKKDDPDVIDWIEIAIDRIERAIKNLAAIVSSSFKSLATRLKAGNEQIKKLYKEREIQEAGYHRYIQEANSVGLPEDLAEKVRNGTIDINQYSKETAELIKEYQGWYEKALDCSDAMTELSESIASVYQEKFDHIATDYENQLSLMEHLTNTYNSGIEEVEERGYLASTEFYTSLQGVEQQKLSAQQKELKDLQIAMSEAMNSGEIEEGSEAWYEFQQKINEVKEGIRESEINMVKFNNAMRDIEWERFDFLQERISSITEEADFLVSLLEKSDLYTEKGQLTDAGSAAMGLHGQNYNVYMAQADKYADEILEINKALADDPNNTVLIERKDELLAAQRDSILAAEDEKQAIVDMVKNGIDLELDSLNKLIDTYKTALRDAKNMYEYQKKIKDQTSEITNIQKQLSAYSGDDSEENRATLQRLNASLKEAQENLEETQYEHYISEQERLLDELYSEYESVLNQRLDNVDLLISDMIERININSGEIRDKISEECDKVGYTITEGTKAIWNNDGGAGMIITKYGDNFEKQLTSVNNVLASIAIDLASMVKNSDEIASGTIDGASATTPVDKSVPPVHSNTPSSGDILGNNQKPDASANNSNAQSGSHADKDYYGVALAVWNGNYGWGSGSTRFSRLKAKGFDAQKVQAIADKMASDGYVLNGTWPGKYYGITNLAPYHYNKYARGGLVDYTGIAQVDGSPSEPEVVLNARDSENFISLRDAIRKLGSGDQMFDALVGGAHGREILKKLASVYNGSDIGPGSARDIYYEINIPIDHVQDYDDFVNQMRRDGKFEQFIQSITVDRLSGGSSIGKNKYRW